MLPYVSGSSEVSLAVLACFWRQCGWGVGAYSVNTQECQRSSCGGSQTPQGEGPRCSCLLFGAGLGRGEAQELQRVREAGACLPRACHQAQAPPLGIWAFSAVRGRGKQLAAHGRSVTSAKRRVAPGTRDPGLTGHPQLITCLENDNTLCPTLLQGSMIACGLERGPQSEPNNMLVFSLALPLLFSCCCSVASVVSDSVRPHRRQPTRLPHPWDSPGKNTGVGCHFLLQCMKVKSESEVAQSCLTLATPWTAAYQASPSMGFSRQKYWSGVPLPSPMYA